MRTRSSLALNGIELHSIDAAIYVRGVDEASPSRNILAGAKGTGEGQFVNKISRQYRDISVRFAIWATKYQIARRAEIVQRVNAWAAPGGILTVNYRDGQQMRVKCTQLAAMKTDDWNEEYQISFRAYEVPYWENTDRTQISVTTASQYAYLNYPGSAEGKLSFTGSNTSGYACNRIIIGTVDGNNNFLTKFDLSSLDLVNNETIVADYDERDILRIRIRNSVGEYRSALGRRTPDSSDDIRLKYGSNKLSIWSHQSLAWNIYTYGRFE